MRKNTLHHRNERSGATDPALKKDYLRPVLTNYGTIAEMTQGGIYNGNEGNSNCVGNAGGNNPLCGGGPVS